MAWYFSLSVTLFPWQSTWEPSASHPTGYIWKGWVSLTGTAEPVFLFVDWQQPNSTAEVVEGISGTLTISHFALPWELQVRERCLAQKAARELMGWWQSPLSTFVLVVSRVLRKDKPRERPWVKWGERKEKIPLSKQKASAIKKKKNAVCPKQQRFNCSVSRVGTNSNPS